MRRLYRYWRSLLKNIMYEDLPRGVWWSVLSCVAYSAFSMNMTFSNKAILSVFNFQFPIFLLFFQHIFTLVIVLSARSAGLIDFTPIQLNNVKKWYPVNFLFILMLVSGSYALKLLSVPMITIFKNIATTFTAIGDFLIFRQKLNTEIVCSIFLMVLSSMVAGINDLAFDFNGYIWMAINCVVSASYVLYMKYAMKTTQLTEWGMVYYNNVLAIPTVIPLLIYSGELRGVIASFGEFTKWTYLVILWTGISGFLLSITSFWAVRTTSPTTYSMVGSLNKVPLTILGFIFFKTPVNIYGGVSIATGLVAGTMYSIVKQKSLLKSEVLPTRRKIDT